MLQTTPPLQAVGNLYPVFDSVKLGDRRRAILIAPAENRRAAFPAARAALRAIQVINAPAGKKP
jgi:hypothetical protein